MSNTPPVPRLRLRVFQELHDDIDLPTIHVENKSVGKVRYERIILSYLLGLSAIQRETTIPTRCGQLVHLEEGQVWITGDELAHFLYELIHQEKAPVRNPREYPPLEALRVAARRACKSMEEMGFFSTRRAGRKGLGTIFTISPNLPQTHRQVEVPRVVHLCDRRVRDIDSKDALHLLLKENEHTLFEKQAIKSFCVRSNTRRIQALAAHLRSKGVEVEEHREELYFSINGLLLLEKRDLDRMQNLVLDKLGMDEGKGKISRSTKDIGGAPAPTWLFRIFEEAGEEISRINKGTIASIEHGEGLGGKELYILALHRFTNTWKNYDRVEKEIEDLTEKGVFTKAAYHGREKVMMDALRDAYHRRRLDEDHETFHEWLHRFTRRSSSKTRLTAAMRSGLTRSYRHKARVAAGLK